MITFPNSWGTLGTYSAHQSPKEQDAAVLQILGQKGYDALHENTTDTENFEAREAFANFLATNLPDFPKARTVNKNPISMKDFLSEKGVDLYKQAIEEERNSQSFRNAVFLASHKHYNGAKWETAKCIHIGGPSGAGKSHARDAIIQQIAESEKSDEAAIEANEGNDVISIDGGIDREVSQIRTIVQGVILSKGFSGGEDLHAKSKKTAIKKYILNAALNSENNLSLVIPDTFANAKHLLKFKMLKKYFKEQIFVTVKADKVQTEVSGNARAWERGDTPFPENQLRFNKKYASDSKKYNSEFFLIGEKFTRAALAAFREEIKGRTYVIENDILHLKEDKSAPGGYRECTGEDTNFDVRTNRRIFKAWQEHCQANPSNYLSLKEWNQHAIKTNTFKTQITETTQLPLRSKTLSTLRKITSPSLSRRNTSYLPLQPRSSISRTGVLTVPHLSLGELAKKLEDSQEKYNIKKVDKTQLQTPTAHLTLDMHCEPSKKITKKVYVEPNKEVQGIKYSMEKLEAEDQKRQMIRQIIELAVDQAKPGAEFMIHPSPNQHIVKEVLDEVLKRKYPNQYTLNDNKYSQR